MGFARRNPALPAPTESSIVESAEDTGVSTDLATDLSRRTDRTSHTIPDDGSPITVTTHTKRPSGGKLSKTTHLSQTSLLIEYYDGKGTNSSSRKPSVRVRVTPSSSRRGKDKKNGHIVVSETHGSLQPSHSRRISLGTDSPGRIIDPGSVSSLEEIGHSPLDIDIKEGSELSNVSRDARYIIAPSDISSMPAESLLDGPTLQVPVKNNHSFSNEKMAGETLISQKVIEKLSNKPRVSSGGRRRQNEKNRSTSQEVPTAVEQESRPSVLESSLLSAGHKSVDQSSFRSATSQSSLNNPRLLQTVEDAIRRLILPELKELKKDQRHASRSGKYDRESPSDISGSSMSQEARTYEEKGRSKGSHGRNSKDSGEVLSSGSKRRHRRRKEMELDSPSERSYRRGSVDSLSVDDDHDYDRRNKNHHRLRDAAAGALVGGALTAMALKNHDSGSSLTSEERRRRRKKRSQSRSSRSASIAESEEIFQKHAVPPMPMRSEVDSELTRSSLLSQKTAGTATPTRREVREVIRGSPREIMSPASQTPTMTPGESRRGLGTFHGNLSERDLSLHKDDTERELHEDRYPPYGSGAFVGRSSGGMGLAAEELLDDPERVRKYESNLHHQHPIRRGLSPIQSVASYTTTEPNRTSVIQPRSVESLGSLKKQQQLNDQMSIDSLSSAPSTDVARSKRPQGISLENRSEIMAQLPGTPGSRTRDLDADDFYDEQHSQNDRYRESYASSDPKIDVRHMTNYTDDSMDAPYLDKVTAGQQVARGYGANPEYIHTPPAVESAVASLYDPSLIDVRGDHSPAQSYTDSFSRRDFDSPRSAREEFKSAGSPLKEQQLVYSREELPYQRSAPAPSPPQSIADSLKEELPVIANVNRSAERGLEQTAKGQDATSPESEITTNPSVIHGPMGGSKHGGDLSHWPYDETPHRSKGQFSPQALSRDIGISDPHLYPEPLNTSTTQQNKQDIYGGQQILSTPLGAKDEGYVTADNPKSPVYSLRPKGTGMDNFAPAEVDMDGFGETDDPFTSKRNRYLSGMSQGMNSPIYDSSTGRGIDRIQSKDIVALMDHLTVRDAQRNARDTEILVTLVRSAAEMRNSFEDMKKFIAEQDDFIMDTADAQHERTQKIIGGPRPQPTATARFTRSIGSEDDDGAKRKNVFRRALQGLGSKNSRELQNIEQMLMQLLGEVEGLRATQITRAPMNTTPLPAMQSVENTRALTDPGYEPEGQAGTSSTGDRSGFFSNNSSRQADYRGASGRRESGNRVSTVIEGDEDFEPELNESNGVADPNGDDARSRNTNRDTFESTQTTRGASVPVSTPPRTHNFDAGTVSADNTPRMSTEGSGNRKHKSGASSFFPRISRWSKTTASSVADNFRSSGQTVNTNKQRPYSQVSRSGSNLDEYDYDAKGDDRLRSNNSLTNEQYRDQENRPPSPLIPSQLSEKPKYQAHRDSMNLQHPQPRQGPTGRFQHHLETEAQNYGDDAFSPTSQTSSHWENQGTLATADHNMNGSRGYTGQQGHLSSTSDGYSETSQGRPASARSGESYASSKQGPPRPPKVRDEDPLVPQRPPKVAMTPPAGGAKQATYIDHVAAARAGSPAFDKSPVTALRSSPGQARKPSGPRPISGSGQFGKGIGGTATIKKTRFRGSPNQIDSDDERGY